MFLLAYAKFMIINYMAHQLENIIAHIKQATNYQTNKHLLREKAQTDLCVPYNGGLFRASPELIAFLSVWDNDELYLEDTYLNPIKCDRNELLSLCKAHYFKVMNSWHMQHEEVKRVRKV